MKKKTRCILIGLTTAILCAVVGFLAGRFASARMVASETEVLFAESFSEIAQLRLTLHDVSGQLLRELRSEYERIRFETAPGDPLRAQRLQSNIAELDHLLLELKGTEREFLVVHQLLHRLRDAGLVDRWLDLYLNTLYEHPTNDITTRPAVAQEAIHFARLLHREPELLAAFRIVDAIPVTFAGQSVIRALLHASTDTEPGSPSICEGPDRTESGDTWQPTPASASTPPSYPSPSDGKGLG